MLTCGLVSEQDAQIAKIVPGGPGYDRVAERVEKRIGVESSECIPYRFGFTAASGTAEGAAIDHRAGRWTVSIDAVGAGAENRDVLSGNLSSAGQCELLVASADTPVADRDRHLAAGDQADARNCAAQFPQAIEQMAGSFVIRPVVARNVYLYGKTGAGGGSGGFIDGNLVGEHRPPARAHEGRVVGFWRLFKSVLTKQPGDRHRKLAYEMIFFRYLVAVVNRGRVGHGRSRGQSVGGVVGYIGNQNRSLLSGIGSLGQATSLNCGQVLADGIDLRDGRAGMDERAVGGGEIEQGDFVVHRSFDQRRATTGNHKDDQNSGVKSSQ